MHIGLCLSVSGLFSGCGEDFLLQEISSDKNVETLRSTRSMVVTVCSDAYVDVAGYSEYKGTTCRTYTVGSVGGLGYGEYHPGGFPQNGSATDRGSGGNGERNYYVGDKLVFPI